MDKKKYYDIYIEEIIKYELKCLSGYSILYK